MPKEETREVAPLKFLTEPTRHENSRAVHPTDERRRALIDHQLGSQEGEHVETTPESIKEETSPDAPASGDDVPEGTGTDTLGL